ncbi:MAG: S41 family peptidase, partial [Gemmataceae bacterium]
ELHFHGVPLGVLINGSTSGGAELIAGALQDHERGYVVGQRTRGKASIQTLLPLPVPSAALKLTSGTFRRPSGKNLNRFPDSRPTDDWGIHPDREIRMSTALQDKLEQWWTWQSLRPGDSREPLPLDDLLTDAQVRFALERLRRAGAQASK